MGSTFAVPVAGQQYEISVCRTELPERAASQVDHAAKMIWLSPRLSDKHWPAVVAAAVAEAWSEATAAANRRRSNRDDLRRLARRAVSHQNLARAAKGVIAEWRRFDAVTTSANDFHGDMPAEDFAPIIAGVRRLTRLGIRFAPEFISAINAIAAEVSNGECDGDTELSVDDGLEDDDPNLDQTDEFIDREDDDRENDDPNEDGSDQYLTEYEMNVDEHHKLDGARAERGDR
jgi:hypothetical protein